MKNKSLKLQFKVVVKAANVQRKTLKEFQKVRTTIRRTHYNPTRKSVCLEAKHEVKHELRLFYTVNVTLSTAENK